MNINPCVIPTERKDIDGDGRWLAMHDQFIQHARQKDAESKERYEFCKFPN